MKLFWQKAEVQKFEHAKDFAEEYNIGKKDFILASKSTYEAYFAALGLEAHVEYKSKYGKGEPTDEMIDALLADFRKTDCDRIIAIGGGAVIDMAKILVLAGDYSAEEIFGRKVPLKRAKTLIAVPTTCGAGSEVSNVSIAEFTKLHTKMGLAVDEIYADRAVLIPELLTGLPYSFFAPIYFMIAISSRLTVIPIVTVLLIRNTDTASRIAIIATDTYPTSLFTLVSVFATTSDLLTLRTPSSDFAKDTTLFCFDTSERYTS